MFTLKPLTKEAVPAALAKAERYRLLNEPWQAESICRDVLAIDHANQAALVHLILSLTMQFAHDIGIKDAWDSVAQLTSEYERCYYSGIIEERRGIALLRHGDHRSGSVVHILLREAMGWYEKAEAIRPAANDDAVLRWNACVRILRRNPQIAPVERQEESSVVGSE